METSTKSSAINLGLYLGGIMALTTILGYALYLELLTKWWLGIILFITIIVFGIISALKSKKMQEGFITFKEAFSSYFITVAIGILISMVISIIIFNFVDPEAALALKEKTIEATIQMMRSFNAPEDAVAEAVDQMEKQKNQFSIAPQLQSNAIFLIIQAVIGLIVALIVKRDPETHNSFIFEVSISNYYMDISVVIPLLNEQESLTELHDWIAKVMQSNRFSYEILFIDDGSTDGSWETIETLSKTDANVKGIRFLKNFGKSQALHAGFEKAQGDVIITMDADLQDNPEEIPSLYKKITEENFDLVSGWKKKRFDNKFTKNLPSKLFNWAARKTSGVKLNDFNCGLKAYKNVVVKNIDINGEMHRYIPVLAKNAGFTKIGEQIVQHQARKYGETKFGMERFINGFLDLITIWFLSRFGKRPMHLFGALGVIMFAIGFAFSVYLGVDKMFFHKAGRLITQRPQFYIALVTMIIGTQFFIAGFLGEIILRSKQNKTRYLVKEELNLNNIASN